MSRTTQRVITAGLKRSAALNTPTFMANSDKAIIEALLDYAKLSKGDMRQDLREMAGTAQLQVGKTSRPWVSV